MKRKLSIMMSVLLCTLVLCSNVDAEAAKLANCFKGWSETTVTRDSNKIWWYKKQSFAQTSDYGKKHYVRCYIGDFKGDSGRVWAKKPYNKVSAKSKKVNAGWSDNQIIAALEAKSVRAYAKYGTKP